MKKLTVNENFSLTVNENFRLELCYAKETKPYKQPTKGRFEIFQSDLNKKYYWNLVSTNGRTILKSLKGFVSIQDAQTNIYKVCEFGTDEFNYEIETENKKEGGLYYLLIDDNGNNVAVSGNGKGYNLKVDNRTDYNIALRQQVKQLGVDKGIMASVKNIQKIVTKQKPILVL